MLAYRRLIYVALIGLALSCTFNPGLNEAKYWPCKSNGECPGECECFDGRVCIPPNTDDDPVLCKWCEPGHVDCDGLAGNGCEANLADDPETCGDCEIQCPDGWLCEVGTCVQGCKAGFLECGGSCVDPLRDPEHCGGCGQACKSGQVCLVGECLGDCGPKLRDCNGSCTNIRSDPENCGECGRLCVLPNARPKCELSVCLVDECIHPFGNCNRRDDDGCETLLKTSAKHCGECGNDCGQNAVCAEAQCGCAEYFGNCDEDWSTGCEIRVKTDPLNCGECGNVCDQPPDDYCEENFLNVYPRLGNCEEYTCVYPPGGTECMFGCESGQCLGDPCEEVSCDEGEICVNGVCACGGTGPDCNIEQACCGTECVYLWNDPDHCGECFASCGQNAHCGGGYCKCNSLEFGDCNYSWADGCETDLMISAENCGFCGNNCGQNAQCISGYCDCQQGFANCDEGWNNGCEIDLNSPGNCGSCGNDCPTDEQCCGGICTDLLQDDLNCGTCGNGCSAGEICCDAICINPMVSSVHCGRCHNTCVANRLCDRGSCGTLGVDCGGNVCDPLQGQVCCYSPGGGMGCNSNMDCTAYMFDCDGPEDCDAGSVCCAVMTAAEATACLSKQECVTTQLCTSDLQCQETNPDTPFCCPESIQGIGIFVCMQQCG